MAQYLKDISFLVETKNMKKWLDDIHFPYKDPTDMLTYLKNKDSTLFQNMIIQQDNGELPQSYAHWWCYQRIQRSNSGPSYPVQNKWLNINREWNETNAGAETKTIDNPTTSGTSIFAMFTCWLDILYVDIVLYSDENRRENVPRLYASGIQWQPQGRETPKSRRETIQYILQQSNEIFLERGFTEGYTYWQKNTKKYLI